MKIKNIVLLAASNIKLALKSALAQFLLLCIFTAIVVLVLNVSAESFSKLFDSGLYETPKMVIEGLLNGGGIDEAVVDVQQLIIEITALFQQGSPLFEEFLNTVFLLYIAITIVIALFNFLIGLTELTVCKCLNDFMTVGVQRPFGWQFFRILGKSALYQLMKNLIMIMTEMLLLCVSVGLYLIFLSGMGIAGVIIFVVIGIMLYAFKLTLFSFWAPAICAEGTTVLESFKKSLKVLVDKFIQVYAYAFIISVVVSAVLGVICYFWGGYVSMALTPVVVYLSGYELTCVSMALYYEAEGKTYFTRKLDMVTTNEE